MNDQHLDVKDLVKVPVAAKQLDHHTNTIRQWVKRYPGVGVKIGNTYRVYGTAIAKLRSGVPLEEL